MSNIQTPAEIIEVLRRYSIFVDKDKALNTLKEWASKLRPHGKEFNYHHSEFLKDGTEVVRVYTTKDLPCCTRPSLPDEFSDSPSLQEKSHVVKKALLFYANKENYEHQEGYGEIVMMDEGHKARTALKQIDKYIK